jgi:hypothetical protein
MSRISDIAHRFDRNPDMLYSGCQVTGKDEPGISFPTVEPSEGSVMFIGDHALHEAISIYYDIPLDESRRRLSGEDTPKQAEFKKLKAELKDLKSKEDLWNKVAESLEAAGLVVTTYET